VQQLKFGLGDLKAELQDLDLTSQPLGRLTEFGSIGMALSGLPAVPQFRLRPFDPNRALPGFLPATFRFPRGVLLFQIRPPASFRACAWIIRVLPVSGKHGKARRDESAKDP
jgi:hypothetical protein